PALVDRAPGSGPVDEGEPQPVRVVERADPDPAGRDRAGAVVLPALQPRRRARMQPGLQVLRVLAASLGDAVAEAGAGQDVREQPLLLLAAAVHREHVDEEEVRLRYLRDPGVDGGD